jgi:hypothetical protein
MPKAPKDPHGLSAYDNTAAEPQKRGEPRPDISHLPMPSERSPTWDKFAGGVRDALGDFVSRTLYGEPGTKQPDKDVDADKGLDR